MKILALDLGKRMTVGWLHDSRAAEHRFVTLDIAPAHLTDIEKGRRSPSEELVRRIARPTPRTEQVRKEHAEVACEGR